MSGKLATYGQWTYRGAWALEITAATIGLATGLALGYQAFAAGQSVTAMDLTLASAPFFMVAIAELTKIPIATLLYTSSWLWKPVLLAFLLLLAGITFETVFMGLERAAALRQLQYETLVNKIDALSTEEGGLASSDARAREVDAVAEADLDLQRVSQAAETSRKRIEQQIGALDVEIAGYGSLTPAAIRARNQLQQLEEQRDRVVTARDREIENSVGQFERQRDSYVTRIEAALERGDAVTARQYREELARLANPRPQILGRYQAQLDEAEDAIRLARAEFDREQEANVEADTAERQTLIDRRNSLQRNLREMEEAQHQQMERSLSRYAAAQESEAAEAATAADNQRRRDEITREKTSLQAQRIQDARQDQIRRIASRWYGAKPEEVTEEQEGLISVIWFGSLAAIAALAGPITAMVALGLQRIAASSAAPPSESKLKRLLRRILLSWRWRRTRTVTVPVEVPVEREVEKRVEVPVERVVKEILYVPVLTDDPEIVRNMMRKDLPPEVADLVKVSVGDQDRASAA